MLHSVESNAAHAGVQKIFQVPVMHIDHLRAVLQLRPLAAPPTLVAVLVIPMRAVHLEPRPLEIVCCEGRGNCRCQLLLQLLQLLRLLLGALPLVRACDNDHVIENNVGDDHHSEALSVLTQVAQVLQGAKAFDLGVVLRLVAGPPLVSMLRLMRRTDLDRVEPPLMQVLQVLPDLREGPMESVEDAPRGRAAAAASACVLPWDETIHAFHFAVCC
mmetsp:Transcript_16143/g.46699  ORF Transcript_16143/g.46699 Transcript_16143/m.46699 type:complete len:216 (+) Transcript_16143:951-1598(+)